MDVLLPEVLTQQRTMIRSYGSGLTEEADE